MYLTSKLDLSLMKAAIQVFGYCFHYHNRSVANSAYVEFWIANPEQQFL